MRAWGFSLIIVIAAGPSWAEKVPCKKGFKGPCTPTKTIQTRILGYAEIGVNAYNDWFKAREQEEVLRGRLIKEKNRRKEYGTEMEADANLDRLISEWEAAYSEINLARKKAESALNAAVSLTLKEYQIDTVPNGPITGGPAQGLNPETTIKIHFPEEDFREVFIDSDGKTVYLYRHAAEMRFAGECSPFGGDAESGTAWNFDRWGSAPPIDSGGPVPYSHRPNSSRNAA